MLIGVGRSLASDAVVTRCWHPIKIFQLTTWKHRTLLKSTSQSVPTDTPTQARDSIARDSIARDDLLRANLPLLQAWGARSRLAVDERRAGSSWKG